MIGCAVCSPLPARCLVFFGCDDGVVRAADSVAPVCRPRETLMRTGCWGSLCCGKILLLQMLYEKVVVRKTKAMDAGVGDITADQALGGAEAYETPAVCPLATLDLGCNTLCVLACAHK